MRRADGGFVCTGSGPADVAAAPSRSDEEAPWRAGSGRSEGEIVRVAKRPARVDRTRISAALVSILSRVDATRSDVQASNACSIVIPYAAKDAAGRPMSPRSRLCPARDSAFALATASCFVVGWRDTDSG